MGQLSNMLYELSTINSKVRNGAFPNVMPISDRKVDGGGQGFYPWYHAWCNDLNTQQKFQKLKDLSMEI